VVSNIAMALGAVCVLPQEFEHTIASSEFTIMRVEHEEFDPWFLWGYLRSAEVRARLLSTATGIARHRVEWDVLKDIPVLLMDEGFQKSVSQRYQAASRAVRSAEATRDEADHVLGEELNLNNDWAVKRLRAAKPPK